MRVALDLGESSGEKGTDEERQTDLRHIYKVESTGINEGCYKRWDQ